jgi:DNA-binding HxlR family transcriptional regulator
MFPRGGDFPAVWSSAMDTAGEFAHCPQYERATEILGRRWTGMIVRALLGGRTRFSEFTASIPGLSDRLLSERLKELEAEGIVTRCVSPATPVRVDYRLTEKGKALAGVVESISAWAEDWLPLPADAKSA